MFLPFFHTGLNVTMGQDGRRMSVNFKMEDNQERLLVCQLYPHMQAKHSATMPFIFDLDESLRSWSALKLFSVNTPIREFKM